MAGARNGAAGAAGAARGAKSVGRLAGRAGRRVRAAAHADGAGPSGLAALVWVHALHSAGDALVTVSLAGTLFFDVPLGEARGRVALYLVLTLLPFSFLVPVAGPLLDRFRHGRRNVMALATGTRGLLAWSMAGLLASLALYPLALAVLVLSRAYGVAKSAAVARVRPPQVSLVAANARLNVAAVAAASAAAAVGALLSVAIGGEWVLRLAALVFVAGAVMSTRLPEQVDEARSTDRTVATYRLRDAPGVVARPLVAAFALRALAGMLTIFLAFLLRADGASGPVIAVVLGGAVLGNVIGTGLASRLAEETTRRLTVVALLVPALVCLVAALSGAPLWASLAAGFAGLGGSLSKFALDAALQTHVPPASTASAFAKSETGLQLSWAVGGAVGVALPSYSGLGFVLAAAFPVAGMVLTGRLRTRR